MPLIPSALSDTFSRLLGSTDRYIDQDHASYYLPAGTTVQPVSPLGRFTDTGDLVLSVDGNGNRAQMPAEEFHGLPRNRRTQIDPEAMRTLGGYIDLAWKMTRQRAMQIIYAVENPDSSQNPFRTNDTLNTALQATIAAGIKLQRVDFFDVERDVLSIAHNLRLMLLRATSGKVKFSFLAEREHYAPAVSKLLAKSAEAESKDLDSQATSTEISAA